jgi:hypothetical protein
MAMNIELSKLKEGMDLYVPVDARPLENGAIQKIYRFANGYGASVVKGDHTYGGEEGLWELAVIIFAKGTDNNHTYELVYDTPITQDVEGNLNDDEVEKLLDQIFVLPMRGDDEMRQQGNERQHA